MPTTIAYEDAVNLLDSDHKLVQKLFIRYQTLHEFGAPAATARSSPSASAPRSAFTRR